MRLHTGLLGIIMTVALGFIGAMPGLAQQQFIEQSSAGQIDALIDGEFAAIEPKRQQMVIQLMRCSPVEYVVCEQAYNNLLSSGELAVGDFSSQPIIEPVASFTHEPLTILSTSTFTIFEAGFGCETPTGACEDMDANYLIDFDQASNTPDFSTLWMLKNFGDGEHQVAAL